jgi:hypothetical protein
MSSIAAYTAIASAIASASAAIYSGVSSYQAGKAASKQYKSAAEAAEQEANARAYESEREAAKEASEASIAQVQGELEAEKRSRLMAADIGSLYANAAGNGLLVDSTQKDTIGSALSTTVKEAQSDISTIRDNAAIDVWTHNYSAGSLLASAGNTRIAGANTAAAYRSKAKSAYSTGRATLIGNVLTGSATAGSGLANYFKD